MVLAHHIDVRGRDREYPNIRIVTSLLRFWAGELDLLIARQLVDYAPENY